MNVSELLRHPQALADDIKRTLGTNKSIQEGLQHMSYADGIMAAVCVGPEVIRPSEWMPKIIDLTGAESFEYGQMAMNMLVLDYNRISTSLANEDRAYEPFLWEDEAGCQVVDDWADGFRVGIGLRGDAWAPILKSEQGRAAMLPIVLFGSDPRIRQEIENSGMDAQKVYAAAREYLPDAVQHIYDYWHPPQSVYARTYSSKTKKTGRNAPCPCGSGRKYKKCCLN